MWLLFVLALKIATASSNVASAHDEMSVRKSELQWQICEKDFEKIKKTFSLTETIPESRQVLYYDTRSLTLTRAGVQVRAKVHGENAKSVVKVRYQNNEEIPWAWLQGKDFKCEEDRYLGSRHIGCSVNGDSAMKLNADQLEFLKREKQMDLSGTQIFGPSQNSKWTFQFEDLEGTYEQILTPAGYLSQEISVRVDLEKADRLQAELTHQIQQNQITLCPSQKGQTAEILQSFLNSSQNF